MWQRSMAALRWTQDKGPSSPSVIVPHHVLFVSMTAVNEKQLPSGGKPHLNSATWLQVHSVVSTLPAHQAVFFPTQTQLLPQLDSRSLSAGCGCFCSQVRLKDSISQNYIKLGCCEFWCHSVFKASHSFRFNCFFVKSLQACVNYQKQMFVLVSPLLCRSWSAGWTLCPPDTGSLPPAAGCHTW